VCACAKSQCVMVQSVEADVAQITGSFHIASVFSYNVVNVGRLIVNNGTKSAYCELRESSKAVAEC